MVFSITKFDSSCSIFTVNCPCNVTDTKCKPDIVLSFLVKKNWAFMDLLWLFSYYVILFIFQCLMISFPIHTCWDAYYAKLYSTNWQLKGTKTKLVGITILVNPFLKVSSECSYHSDVKFHVTPRLGLSWLEFHLRSPLYNILQLGWGVRFSSSNT